MPLSNLIFLLLLSRKCKWITPTFLLTAVLSMQTFGDKLKIANPETHKGWLFDSIFLQTCRAPEQPVASSTAPMPRHCPVVSFCLLHPCQGGESLLSQTLLTTAERNPRVSLPISPKSYFTFVHCSQVHPSLPLLLDSAVSC